MSSDSLIEKLQNLEALGAPEKFVHGVQAAIAIVRQYQAEQDQKPSYSQVESYAKEIYAAMQWAVRHTDNSRYTPNWQEGGNSFAQDEARKHAIAIAAMGSEYLQNDRGVKTMEGVEARSGETRIDSSTNGSSDDNAAPSATLSEKVSNHRSDILVKTEKALDAILYDIFQNFTVPSMQGKTMGELRDYAAEHIKTILRPYLLTTKPDTQPQRERWNIERSEDGQELLVCENDHEKGVGCDYEKWVRWQPEPVRPPFHVYQYEGGGYIDGRMEGENLVSLILTEMRGDPINLTAESAYQLAEDIEGLIGRRTTEPVSLARCVKAMDAVAKEDGYRQTIIYDPKQFAKAVLEASGVNYAE